DILERVWDQLGPELPQDCRCLLYGTPSLVHPVSGVVLAVCYGTQYCLRLPKSVLISTAWREGARTSMMWTLGGRTNIRKEFGRDWIFGCWSAKEIEWCQAVYRQFNFCDLERRVTVDPGWLAWNHGTVPTIAKSIYDDGSFHHLPILADALEEAGCTNSE